MNLYVRRQNAAVKLLGLLLDATKDVLRLLAAAHQNHAFDSVIVVFDLVLKAKDSEARSVANHDLPHVFNPNRPPIIATDHDLADVVGRFQKAKASDVIKLSALRVKPAAGIGIVSLQRIENLHHRKMKIVEPCRIEQHVR